jgi:hypothetical protein
MLIELGFSEEYLIDLEEKIKVEIEERIYIQFTKFHVVYAHRVWREEDLEMLSKDEDD